MAFRCWQEFRVRQRVRVRSKHYWLNNRVGIIRAIEPAANVKLGMLIGVKFSDRNYLEWCFPDELDSG
jgi:hypothetical protein